MTTTEDTTARRDSLRNLCDRAFRGALTYGEARLLGQHVTAEIREGDRARQQAARLEPALIEQERLAAEMQTADRIRAEAQRDRDQHSAVLRDVLDQFADWPAGGTFWPESGVVAKVSTETWDRWDAVAAPTAERPWWEQLSEIRRRAERAEERERQAKADVLRLGLMVDEYGQGASTLSEKLREARAAIALVRALADRLADSKHRGQPGIPHPVVSRILLEALDGPEKPAAVRRCDLAYTRYPETAGTKCTEPTGHAGPHAGPLVFNGRESGGLAWCLPGCVCCPITPTTTQPKEH